MRAMEKLAYLPKCCSRLCCFKSLARLPTKRRKSLAGHWARVGSDHVWPAADRMFGLLLVLVLGGGGGGCCCWMVVVVV